jgi:CBS domain-containing protein
MNRLTVRDLMTQGVFAVKADDDLATVSDLMDERRIRHAPVVNQGRLVGLISHRDLMRYALKGQVGASPESERRAQLTLRAEEIMTRDVATAAPGQDIRQAARLMLEGKYGCLPVVEDSRLVGMLTESDFVRFLASGD